MGWSLNFHCQIKGDKKCVESPTGQDFLRLHTLVPLSLGSHSSPCSAESQMILLGPAQWNPRRNEVFIMLLQIMSRETDHRGRERSCRVELCFVVGHLNR